MPGCSNSTSSSGRCSGSGTSCPACRATACGCGSLQRGQNLDTVALGLLEASRAAFVLGKHVGACKERMGANSKSGEGAEESVNLHRHVWHFTCSQKEVHSWYGPATTCQVQRSLLVHVGVVW